MIISFNYFQSTEIIYGCKDFRYGVEYDIEGNPVVVVFSLLMRWISIVRRLIWKN